jgi:tetratricopeptide (TPR) repeat protein
VPVIQDVMMKFRFYSLPLLFLAFQGCTSPPVKPVAPDNTSTAAPVTKADTPAKPAAGVEEQKVAPAPQPKVSVATPPASPELTGEILYYILSAEIAGQRGQMKIAALMYLKAAEVSKDLAIIERATRVSVYARDDVSALKAAKLWAAQQPDSIDANQVIAALLLRQGNVDASIPYFKKVLDSEQLSSQNGFLLITSLLSKEKDKQAALDVMEQLIDGREDEPEAMYAYAHLAMLVGELQVAESTVNQVLEVRPEWTDAHILRANILLREGKTEEVMSLMKQAVDNYPENKSLRLFYARKLVDEKHFKQGRDQFAILLEQQPESMDSVYALGLLNLQLQDTAEARKYFEMLIESDSRVAEAHYYLGQSYEIDKQDEAAIREYGEIRDGNLYIDAQIRIAILLARQGNIDAARERLQTVSAPTLDTELRLYLAEGEILIQAGQYLQAYDVYTVALQEMPDNIQLLYARALTAEKLDRVGKAIDDFKRIIKLEPSNVEALNALGYTMVDKTPHVEEGMRYIEQAYKMKPDDAAILDSMGWGYYRLGEHKKALRYLQQAFNKMKDPEIAAHLGEVLWVNGDHAGAQQVWADALRETPEDKILINVIERFTK